MWIKTHRSLASMKYLCFEEIVYCQLIYLQMIQEMLQFQGNVNASARKITNSAISIFYYMMSHIGMK